MSSPGVATPADRVARRALLQSLAKHGSEERKDSTPVLSPVSLATNPIDASNETRSPDPTHTVPVLTRGTGSDREAPSPEAEAAAHCWKTAPIDEWTTPMVTELLESYGVPEKGIRFAIDLGWTGSTLRVMANDSGVHETLSEDLHLTSRGRQVTILDAIHKGIARQKTADAAGKDHSTPTTPGQASKTPILTGEKSLKIPSVPPAAPGQSQGLPTQTSWKNFMIAVQGWAKLGSEDYSGKCPFRTWAFLSTSPMSSHAFLGCLLGLGIISLSPGTRSTSARLYCIVSYCMLIV